MTGCLLHAFISAHDMFIQNMTARGFLSHGRDLRLRQYLGVRYDSRLNVFDWDHSMNLIERGVSCVVLNQR